MKFSFIAFMCIFFAAFTSSCNSSQKIASDNTPGHVIVLLDRSVQPTKLEKDLHKYMLKNLGQTSRSEYRFLYSFDSSKIKEDDLLKEINALSYASDAQISKQEGN